MKGESFFSSQVGMGSNGHDVAGTDISSDWTSCSVTHLYMVAMATAVA